MEKMILRKEYYFANSIIILEFWLYKYTDCDVYFQIKVYKEFEFFKEEFSKFYKGMATAFSMWSLLIEYYKLIEENDGRISKNVKRAKLKARVFSNLNSIEKEDI